MRKFLMLAIAVLLLTSCGDNGFLPTSTPVVGTPVQPTATANDKQTETGFYWPTGTKEWGNYSGWMASGCDDSTGYT